MVFKLGKNSKEQTCNYKMNQLESCSTAVIHSVKEGTGELITEPKVQTDHSLVKVPGV